MIHNDRGTMKALAIALAAAASIALPQSAFAASDDSSGAASCCVVALVIFAVVNLALVVWLMNDAHNRGASPGGWILVFLLFGPIALLAYMIVRPRGKLVPCPECGRQKPIVDQICPHCGRRVV
jgi:uncharacterized membrane protein YraQ (UPF0718 family)